MTNDACPQEAAAWPPQFTLRRSSRVKYARIFISQKSGLEVVVPIRHRKESVVENLLNEHRHWIIRTLHRYGLHNGLPLPRERELIQQLHFPAFNETWSVQYKPTIISRIKLRTTPDNIMVLEGDINNSELYIKTLRKWLNNRGKLLLLPQLQEISLSCGLNYHVARIRYQKTRWGSCSAKKLISLNHKLLFLPEHIIRYVMIHELCHTVHLNHSRRFWNLVAQFDANYYLRRRELRHAGLLIPGELH